MMITGFWLIKITAPAPLQTLAKLRSQKWQRRLKGWRSTTIWWRSRDNIKEVSSSATRKSSKSNSEGPVWPIKRGHSLLRIQIRLCRHNQRNDQVSLCSLSIPSPRCAPAALNNNKPTDRVRALSWFNQTLFAKSQTLHRSKKSTKSGKNA